MKLFSPWMQKSHPWMEKNHPWMESSFVKKDGTKITKRKINSLWPEDSRILVVKQ